MRTGAEAPEITTPPDHEKENGMAFFSGLRQFRRGVDPSRFPVAQQPLADSYAAAVAMAQQFEQLQQEQRRLALQRGRNRRAAVGRGSGVTPLGPEGRQTVVNSNRPPLAEQIGASIADQVASTEPFIAEGRRQFDEAVRLKGINGWGYARHDGDFEELSRHLFAEAAGTPEDMAAIAAATLNRVRPRREPGANRYETRPTLREVLRVPNQYSYMPNQGRTGPAGSDMYVLYAHPEEMTPEQRRIRAMAQRIAGLALAGKLRDPTGGATAYFASHGYDGHPESAPNRDFQRMLAAGLVRPSDYHSPYPPRPDHPGAPAPNYFFYHHDDLKPE
jgi:hypothetical protein